MQRGLRDYLMKLKVGKNRLSKLKKEQLKLAKKVIIEDKVDIKELKLIGGCDQAFFDDKIISSIIILNKELDIIEKKYSISKINFPYIPGFLSYREVPSVIKTYKKLKYKPDILLCDFNGILHPIGIGAASHLGVLLDTCTIGVAKSLLCGKIKGDYVFINNKKVGYQLKTDKFKPIYISPGNKISLKTSIEIVKKLIIKNRLPEPIRLAHLYANEAKKNMSNLQ